MSLRPILTLGLTLLFLPAVQAETRLLRFPDVYRDQVAFCYAGDLWLAPVRGGTARRLTAHPGQELFPKFSPDGRFIAFTGQYDGDEQVYVIPTTGGSPRQLTFYPARGPLPARWGYDNQVYGWTPDGKAILFRSLRQAWNLGDTRLYTVPRQGGLPQALPMPVSGAGDFSPDGAQMVYSPLFRDFRTWKRYQGGWAQDLYIFNLEDHTTRRITRHPRTDRDPMWLGQRIYFASDRTGTLNLYSYDIRRKRTRQLTRSTTWDVRWPSAGPGGQIVYELGGQLEIFDTHSSKSHKITIDVPDDGLSRRPSHLKVARWIEDFSLAPKGKRALFVARGDVFTVPVEHGPTRNLTHSSGAHDRWARWSPDGRRIAFISDRDGEDEVYVVNQEGYQEPEQLTRGGHAMRYAPEWSPDGKRLAFSDKEGRLFVLTLEDRRLEEVARDRKGRLFDYTWSPRGGHLAFSLSDEDSFRSIYIWSVADRQLHRVTGSYFNEYNPAWDPDGHYLFYLSDRELAPQIGSFEFNYVVDRATEIFALALQKEGKPLFPPRSDEVSAQKKEEKKEAKKEEKEKKEEIKPVRIDFEGLGTRVMRVPVEADNYDALAAIQGHLLYLRRGPFYYGRGSDVKPELKIFSIKDRKASTLAQGVSGAALSPDGSKILVRQGKKYLLPDAKPGGEKSKKTISTSGLAVDRVPAEEWAEIFNEVWRRYRDFYYVENMHGYDWAALKQRYQPLLRWVAHRADLNYVIGEMIAELSTSHSYIAGGDYQIPERPPVALPGALFELDRSSGRYRISRILRGENEEERYRAPLTEIGVKVKEGDYVLSIEGQDLKAPENPYRLLRFQADHPVRMTVNDRPTREGSHTITFRPIRSESELYYFNWVAKNRRKVEEMSGGRAGYLHLPDMGADGIREFIKWFYGQRRKEGLVIDVRGNGGGNVSQMLIERLGRRLLGLGYSRNNQDAEPYPDGAYIGHLVCILNEDSASDGDIFPAMFRQAGLGPLIGKRSWGGVIGISGHGPLIDGGTVFVPEYGFASREGKWIIEGHGVDPDIVVENDPKSVIEGRDPQLERAVQELMKRIKAKPPKFPPRPAPPVEGR